MSGRVAVGEAVRPQGIRGAVRVHPWLDEFEDYRNIRKVFLQNDPSQEFEVESLQQGGKGSVIWKFKGMDSPEAAEQLRGAVFLADRDALPGQEDGVIYWEDFEGLDAVDESGRLLGQIVDMFGAKGNDVIVIRSPEGDELLMPAISEVVLRREGEKWVFRPLEFEGDESEEEPNAI